MAGDTQPIPLVPVSRLEEANVPERETDQSLSFIVAIKKDGVTSNFPMELHGVILEKHRDKFTPYFFKWSPSFTFLILMFISDRNKQNKLRGVQFANELYRLSDRCSKGSTVDFDGWRLLCSQCNRVLFPIISVS
jgi:hypothetical protein